MKAAIIGAGRNRNGIGEYIGKYFHEGGAAVTAVLGTSQETARRAASGLQKYGISAQPHTDFDSMLEQQRPDAVIIASPAETHRDYIDRCLDAGVDIFCEKPFIWPGANNLHGMLDSFFARAGEKNLNIAMNSQWPFSVPFYEKLCGSITPQDAGSFCMRLSPTASGREMIPDSAPHALSILYHTLGPGDIAGIEATPVACGMDIAFQYHTRECTCRVTVKLVRQDRQPRDFAFGFNDRVVRRTVKPDNYTIAFSRDTETVPVPDPLRLSVRDFISAARQHREPVVGRQHIVTTTLLLKKIYDSCEMEKQWKN